MPEREGRPTPAKVKAAADSIPTSPTTVPPATDAEETGALTRDLYFAQVPEWVLYHPELSAQAVRLYAVLDRYAEGRCWPSRSTLAKQLNVKSTDTIDRALRELVDVAAISIERRVTERGDPTSNAYTVHATPPEGVAARMRPPSRTDAATGSRTDAALTRATTNQRPPNPHGCAVHPGAPSANCRACGTNPRTVQHLNDQQLAHLEREQQRQAHRAHTVAAKRDSKPSDDPEVQQLLVDVRHQLRSARR